MLIDISHSTVYHHSLRTKELCAGRHQSTPACGREALGLLDVHDGTVLVVVNEVLLELGRRCIARLNHLHGDCGAKYATSNTWGEHFDAVEKSAIRILQFDESIANLRNSLSGLWLICLPLRLLTSHVVNLRRASRARGEAMFPARCHFRSTSTLVVSALVGL